MTEKTLLKRGDLQQRWDRCGTSISADLRKRRIPKPIWIGVKPYWRAEDIERFERGEFDVAASWTDGEAETESQAAAA